MLGLEQLGLKCEKAHDLLQPSLAVLLWALPKEIEIG